MTYEKVSIVMCTFNGAKYVRQQLQTLLRQTYPIYEILVQDDGSTDQTMHILREFAAKHPHIRLTANNGPHGINNNFFSAMRRAQGTYIAISDQDDLWQPDKIERQMAAIGDNLLCACRSKPFSTDGSPVNYDPRRPNCHLIRLLYSSIPGHTMLFHRRLLDMLPDTDYDYKTYYDVFLSLTAACHQSLVLVDEFLVLQRRHSEAATYAEPDRRRSPSTANGLYILAWSLCHFARVRPYMHAYFQRRLRLLQHIPADGPLYRDAVAIAALEGRRGLGSLLRLCRLHVRHRHHLFYAEGCGPVNFLRAALYCVMQVYNYRYLLPNTHHPSPITHHPSPNTMIPLGAALD